MLETKDTLEVWKMGNTTTMLDYQILKRSPRVVHQGTVMIKFNCHGDKSNTGFKIKYKIGSATDLSQMNITATSNGMSNSKESYLIRQIYRNRDSVQMSEMNAQEEYVPFPALWFLYRPIEIHTGLIMREFGVTLQRNTKLEIWHNLESQPIQLNNVMDVELNTKMQVRGRVAVFLWVQYAGLVGPLQMDCETEPYTGQPEEDSNPNQSTDPVDRPNKGTSTTDGSEKNSETGESDRPNESTSNIDGSEKNSESPKDEVTTDKSDTPDDRPKAKGSSTKTKSTMLVKASGIASAFFIGRFNDRLTIKIAIIFIVTGLTTYIWTI